MTPEEFQSKCVQISHFIHYELSNWIDLAVFEYSRAMKWHFWKFGNQMSGSGNHLCNYASLLA